jgi:hypothetical protein
MGLLTAVMYERVSDRAAKTMFVPLLVFGAVSVAYWYWSEVRGAGDAETIASSISGSSS